MVVFALKRATQSTRSKINMKTATHSSSTLNPRLTSRTAQAVLALAVWGLTSLTVSRAAIYTEDFNHATSGANQAVSTEGWSAYMGAGATNVSTVGDPNSGDAIAISGSSSYPPYVGSPATYGALYAANRNTVSLVSAAVTTFTSATALNLTAGNTISWNMGNSTTTPSVRLMIQLGGDGSVGSGSWYASSLSFSNSSNFGLFSDFANATSGVSYSLNFSTLAADWRSVTLTPGAELSLGSTLGSNLSSTTITGIGFYMVNGSTLNSNIRLDNLTVVPEPTSVALAVGALGMLAFVVRRRQS
ncbi:MAG: hypothetical protein B9S32_02175 [Verrucomicrobia bacterium Tous-C9LFEB]|nr:MAG: hypothetical protein B9S32_02175 [Verrucomicrobia bacterium Tous-C9LFEB]